MINATIKEGHGGFYNQYGEKKFVLLEEGQTLTIERQEADQYICSVVNPSDESKRYGVIDGVLFLAYKEDLEIVNMASVLFNGMREEADQS
jgi:hypothetical protein